MFKKLFGGQKSAYFLELDESKSQQPEKAKEEAKAKEKAPAKPVEEKKAEPAKATAAEKPKAEPAKAKATKKTSVKDNAKAAPEPKETKPAVSDPEEIIRAAVFKNSSNGKVDPAAVSFASNGSIAPTMSRRRPGPSLNMFKNMARQVKSSKKN